MIDSKFLSQHQLPQCVPARTFWIVGGRPICADQPDAATAAGVGRGKATTDGTTAMAVPARD
jgi:hypothetical protein